MRTQVKGMYMRTQVKGKVLQALAGILRLPTQVRSVCLFLSFLSLLTYMSDHTKNQSIIIIIVINYIVKIVRAILGTWTLTRGVRSCVITALDH